MRRRAKLMIPGPVEVGPEVLAEMARPLTPHYEEAFARLHAETVGMAKEVFGTQGDLFIMVGSGTAGLEACLGGIAGNGGRTLVPTNGSFGELLAKIARTFTSDVEQVQFPWERPVRGEQLAELLEARTDVRSVAVVHCETHTSVVNPIQEYGEVCREHDVLLMVDAVASLGGARLEMDSWKVDLCVTASQKALGAPPGLCLVAVHPRCWPVLEQRQAGPGWYLNLNAWRERATGWADWHPTLTTMAVSNFLALRKALEMALEEGLEERWARHRQVSSLVRKGFGNLGLKLFAEEGWASPTVTTALLPGELAPGELRSFVEEEHGIMVAGSMGPLADKAIRVGHMGPSATVENALSVLFAVEGFLRAKVGDVSVGRCVEGLDGELLSGLSRAE